MQPTGETRIAEPLSPTPGSQDWNGGVFTYRSPSGAQVRVGRTRNGIDRGGETWVELSQDGGNQWHRMTAITKQDEEAGGKKIASVERPYIYSKIVEGEERIVLGTCAAEQGSKRWDIHEREAPIAHLEQLKTAPLRVALRGNAEYAYKDGVPLQSPDGEGVYLAATRHHIGGTPESAVNADTVLCKLNEKTGEYAVLGPLLERGERGGIDATCNRLSSELIFADGSRFWGCDIRNAETPNASRETPLIPGRRSQWALGDFDEVTSFAIGRWEQGSPMPESISVDAILGRSQHTRYPTLRYLGIAPLLPAEEIAHPSPQSEAPAIALTYEKAGATGAKCTYQQIISQKELAAALAKPGELILGEDPVELRARQRAM